MSTAIVKLEFLPLKGDELKQWMPEFEVDQRLTDPAKIAASLEAKKQKWMEDAGNHTFTSRLGAVGGYIYAASKDPLEAMPSATPNSHWVDHFYFTGEPEEKLYEKLVKTLNQNKVTKMIWHNVDKLNMRLRLLGLKHQMARTLLFTEVLFHYDDAVEGLSKNILLSNLQKYFQINSHKYKAEPHFADIEVVSQIYERTI